MKNRLIIVLFALLVAPFINGCGSTNVTPEQTWFDMYLEDSPADYQNLLLTFSSADIFDGQKWVGLSIKKVPIYILTLTGGVNDNIVSQPLAAGRYTKIRFNIDETGSAMKYMGEQYKMGVPVEYRSLEIPIDYTVVEGRYNYMFCDVDAAASVYQVNDSTFQMRPVITVAGADWGVVRTYVTNDKGARIDKAMLCTFTDTGSGVVYNRYSSKTNGMLFARIPAGEYSLTVTPDSEVAFEAVTVKGSVRVVAGQATELNGIVLPAKGVTDPGTAATSPAGLGVANCATVDRDVL